MMRIPKATFCLYLLACLVATGRAAGEDIARSVEKPVRQAIETRQTTQKAESRWRSRKEEWSARYEEMRRTQAQLEARASELRKTIASTRARISEKEEQLADIEQLSKQVQPFLEEMHDILQSRLAADLPFLAEERRQRMARLETLLQDPEVALSEKYRKIMEALLIEAEYGFTADVNRKTISVDGRNLLADIFRLGRISLFYQSLDRKRCGFYDIAAHTWRPLPSGSNPSIRTAIEIAAKRRPAELLALPLGRMVIQ